MASPTPSRDEVVELLVRAQARAAEAALVRKQYRRRSHPGDSDRRRALEGAHEQLKDTAEDLRRERIRAARDKAFGRAWGHSLELASEDVKRERYKTYRMLNPGGKKWTQ